MITLNKLLFLEALKKQKSRSETDARRILYEILRNHIS